MVRSRCCTNSPSSFRNQYDNDISTFSPHGRLHQIEYALEAVKQGSACVGIKSDRFVVLVALQRQGGELASYQKKVVKLDGHMGISFAGLTSDARVLSNYLRSECMRHKMTFSRPLPTYRASHRYGSRPYGVGFLIAGHDAAGPHLYEFSPAGNCLDYVAHAIGSRAQSARTYLEKHVAEFATSSVADLIRHGLGALRETMPSDKDLTVENVAIAVVGVTENPSDEATIAAFPHMRKEDGFVAFHALSREEVDRHLKAHQQTAGTGAAAAGGDAPAAAAGEAMDTSE
ncbi:hypothetical protein AMAG_16006 [Allomyces macrogynus ATCC 38327]|uniref:Proteasome subunit alpha type n=1 Tax=Allomyces macrogynus (strain ATCC 38327) TaxID=578462 RepID=A0A0L0TB97_ALLM3|nr:hypothetical protein AMAG_16006 [Allomyces macrogynus ATCC 38327]|eukprot:KNE72068.1 hypothetical protein AMAG_16006 [Allomyces macrogynus ATCC 38327]